MKPELQLQLQAYLDGELSGREARQVAALVEQNHEAQSLQGELRMTKAFLAGNEPEVTVPESREFYWSQIEREIARAEQAPASAGPGFLLAWRKHFAPLVGVALVVFLAVGVVQHYDLSLFDGNTQLENEVENNSEFTSSFSFRSHPEKMFVVWVQDKSDETVSEVDLELMDEAEDVVIQ